MLVVGCEAPHWSYEGADGPSHWGELNDSWILASTGREQSPIDISNPIPATLQAIEFHFVPSEATLVNTGHTIMVKDLEHHSWIRLDGVRYYFEQYHFHVPSEHTIDGHHVDMEFHIVFRDDVGHFAVVSLMADEGPRSPVFGEILERVPKQVGGEVVLPDMFDRTERMLPSDRRYYRYRGSLTTPPCTEGVAWLVLQERAHMSREQIEEFRALYDQTSRPVQPLYDRIVLQGQ
jgi:carbonic anhydrase